MATKKTTKKTTSKKKTAKKAPAKKKAPSKKKVAKKEPAVTLQQPIKVIDPIDQLWEEVRSLPINVFAIPHHQVEQYFRRVRGMPGGLCVMPTVSAALPALETTLQAIEQPVEQRTPEGDPIRVMHPKYEMTNMDGGYILIKRYVPPAMRSELQPVHGGGVVTVLPPK